MAYGMQWVGFMKDTYLICSFIFIVMESFIKSQVCKRIIVSVSLQDLTLQIALVVSKVVNSRLWMV